ncbi:MAG TPA: SdiA-regulated domain-containing protein [Rhodothermales bacterium]|nr:SdiA-regulated domain-containing protein [Rhodothermales bacterium]
MTGLTRHTCLSILAGLLALTLITACRKTEAPPPETTPAAPPPYDFSHPAAVFTLPASLVEISGLTLLDSLHLGAIQDENGTLYVLDTRSGKISREVAFGEDGDYEGVEQVNGQVFILRSDGALFAIQAWEGAQPLTVALRTKLPGGCDAEGLASDRANGRLLIACKGSTEASGEHVRPVYALDLSTLELTSSPVLLLNARNIAQTRGYDRKLDRKLRDLTAPFTDLSGFTPSALAADPESGHLLVLSSGQKAVVVLDSSGSLLDLWRLPEQLFPQPEGIALAPDGTLYLSSEGADPTSATLLRYAPRR